MARKILALVVHHSASGTQGVDVQTIREWHLARGFRDVGYSKILLADGTIQQGRPDDEVGAHVSPTAGIGPLWTRWNRDSLSLCLVGNFENYAVPAAQWASLVDACARLCKRYGLKSTDIYGHREATRAGYTVCPGKHLDLGKLRAAVQLLL